MQGGGGASERVVKLVAQKIKGTWDKEIREAKGK